MDVAKRDVIRTKVLNKLNKMPMTDKQVRDFDEQLIFAQHLIHYLEEQIEAAKKEQQQIKQSDPIEWNELNDVIRRMYETIDEQNDIIKKIMKKFK
jgi:hypothetical protein